MEIIENNPDKPWDWEWISNNDNITIDFVEKHIDKPWDWEQVSWSDYLTMEFIEKYPDKPWDWEGILENPNLTLEMIDKYYDKNWNWKIISEQIFKKDYENELLKLQNFKNIEEELIQKTWHPSRFQKWCIDEDQKR